MDASKISSQRLPDNLAEPNKMTRVIEGILDYEKTGTYSFNGEEQVKEFRVENVTFSGLIGEPLVAKRSVMAAMKLLVDAGLRVGIFTNGVLMDESTWETIVRIAYVHLSLDAARGVTYGLLKYGNRLNGTAQFDQALNNLRNLVKFKENTPGSALEINASFILYPENYREVFEAAKILKDIGVTFFRVKRDISGQRLLTSDQKQEALKLLDRIRNELVGEGFQLVEIHRLNHEEEMERSFSRCLITELVAAIGSDGHLYPCNYHPRPGGATYGSVIDATFREVWEGSKRKETKQGIPRICPAMCDPFKNRSNKLLAGLDSIYQERGLGTLESYTNDL
ncbi:MAG: SPASM domain-containing protein [Pyrinomonadaceae bacterium]